MRFIASKAQKNGALSRNGLPPPTKQGFFSTYIIPAIKFGDICGIVGYRLLVVDGQLFTRNKISRPSRAQQAAATSALLDANNLLKADSKSLEDWKRILTLRPNSA